MPALLARGLATPSDAVAKHRGAADPLVWTQLCIVFSRCNHAVLAALFMWFRVQRERILTEDSGLCLDSHLTTWWDCFACS